MPMSIICLQNIRECITWVKNMGAQCGAGFNLVPQSQNPAGGYCAPIGSDLSGGPKYDDFAKGKLAQVI